MGASPGSWWAQVLGGGDGGGWSGTKIQKSRLTAPAPFARPSCAGPPVTQQQTRRTPRLHTCILPGRDAGLARCGDDVPQTAWLQGQRGFGLSPAACKPVRLAPPGVPVLGWQTFVFSLCPRAVVPLGACVLSPLLRRHQSPCTEATLRATFQLHVLRRPCIGVWPCCAVLGVRTAARDFRGQGSAHDGGVARRSLMRDCGLETDWRPPYSSLPLLQALQDRVSASPQSPALSPPAEPSHSRAVLGARKAGRFRARAGCPGDQASRTDWGACWEGLDRPGTFCVVVKTELGAWGLRGCGLGE